MKRIAVFFPGIGYHCDKPLLYFSRALARDAGYQEIIALSYAVNMTDLRGNPDRMRAAGLALLAQAEDALKNIDWQEYGDILFISKSVGTGIAAAYAQKYNIICRNVFYTPVALTFGEHPRNGIAFTGTNDPWVETDIVISGCKQAGISLTIIQDGNHSLETDNPIRNLDILKSVMTETKRYIWRENIET